MLAKGRPPDKPDRTKAMSKIPHLETGTVPAPATTWQRRTNSTTPGACDANKRAHHADNWRWAYTLMIYHNIPIEWSMAFWHCSCYAVFSSLCDNQPLFTPPIAMEGLRGASLLCQIVAVPILGTTSLPLLLGYTLHCTVDEWAIWVTFKCVQYCLIHLYVMWYVISIAVSIMNIQLWYVNFQYPMYGF